MGRSQLTTTDKLNRLTDQLTDFRRALMSRNHQIALDQLFAVAKNNRLAMSQVPDMLPVDALQIVMLIDLQCQIDQLKRSIGSEHD